MYSPKVKRQARRCEGEHSLKPQARISLNFRVKEYLPYLALPPSFYEHYASVLEKITILEISLISREVCFDPVDRLLGTRLTSASLSFELSTRLG
jgi:hypothetical protein